MASGFIGIPATKKKPTKKHRPALWENMLGTVYARNAAGETKYFDYDWEGAKAFAGVENGFDKRVWKYEQTHYQYHGMPDHPRKGQVVLWIIDPEPK